MAERPTERDGANAPASHAFGPWVWLAIGAGALLRLYLVLFTEGTYDVRIWAQHAEGVFTGGLLGYYHANPDMNHPPLVSHVAAWLWAGAEGTGIPFRVLLRAPFAALDAGTAWLLLQLLKESAWGRVAALGFWLHPLAILLSSYHGNTDSAIAFFLVLSLHWLAQGRHDRAAAVMGASLWIKLPGVLALPAFVLFLPDWPRRIRFVAIVGGVGLATYLPALARDAAIVLTNVFGYRGQLIHTTAGVPVWGTRIFLPWVAALPEALIPWVRDPFVFYLKNNTAFTLGPILLWCAARRTVRTVPGLAATVAGSYVLLYGLSNYWSFQYFAWSIPLWAALRPAFALPASLLATAYLYGLYALLCGNPWLLGEWDFIGHPHWPAAIEWLRDATCLFFFASACVLLAGALRDEIRRWRPGRQATPPA